MLDAFRDTALAAATAAEDKSLVWRRDFNNFDRRKVAAAAVGRRWRKTKLLLESKLAVILL